MGILPATCVIVSLRDRKSAYPTVALSFILLAAAWSVATPIIVLLGNMALSPVLEPALDKVPRQEIVTSVVFFALFVGGSAIGSSGYWLLVRLFWLKSLRYADWLRTVLVCAAATLLSAIALGGLNPNADFFGLILTAMWWFAFSLSLYWSKTSGSPISNTAMDAVS
jgi:hypothetical protein